MPIRPQPMRVRCPHCHWNTIIAPRSDAISSREWSPSAHAAGEVFSNGARRPLGKVH